MKGRMKERFFFVVVDESYRGEIEVVREIASEGHILVTGDGDKRGFVRISEIRGRLANFCATCHRRLGRTAAPGHPLEKRGHPRCGSNSPRDDFVLWVTHIDKTVNFNSNR